MTSSTEPRKKSLVLNAFVEMCKSFAFSINLRNLLWICN